MATAWHHLVVEIGRTVTPEDFHAAFPLPAESLFILDGGGAPSSHLDRYAFMGAEPVATLRIDRRRDGSNAHGRAVASVVHDSAEPHRRDVQDDVAPFDALRKFIAEHAPPTDVFDDAFPFPFRAGMVGYIGYEAGQFLERMPSESRPSIAMPIIAFALYRWVIATRHDTERSWLSVLGTGSTHADARADAERRRTHVEDALARASSPASAHRPSVPSANARRGVEMRLSRSEYIDRIATAKEHIAAGDAFEICLTNTLSSPFPRSSAWRLSRELRRSNPAPFAAYLDLPEGVIVSSSPERFLSLDTHRVAESRPIKGTRPRGLDLTEDARLATELRTSEKDRAENTMIVDLVRNDLGKVCRFGSVLVPELCVVESYATVHQLVSTVRGELALGKDNVDLLAACFPPGSMTGAPKIEAMTILERLEPVERGVYSGALGWIDLGGAMDLSVVIRAAVIADGVATFSVGGAIVADSDPTSELEETEHKARALVRAIDRVTRDLDVRHEPRTETMATLTEEGS